VTGQVVKTCPVLSVHSNKQGGFMKWMILLLTFFSAMGRTQNAESVKIWAVGKESKISIQGSSNVNTFTFDLKQYSKKDTLIAVQKTSQLPVLFRKGILHLPVDDFKNANPFLTKDFKKIIKAKSYPEIVMIFRSLNSLPATGTQNQRLNAEVEICLAGKSKIFQICLTSTRNGENIFVQGSEHICFSDFGLTAPGKVMGFITVKDQLTVEFQLSLKVLYEG
jgi:hypothetical protein